MQASGKTIGILSAVVLGGLGLWYMTKDDEETLEDTTTPMVTPSGNSRWWRKCRRRCSSVF